VTQPNQNTSRWSPEQKARAAELWARGRSARQVAEAASAEFGFTVTRNAIIGLANRSAWPKHGDNKVRYAGVPVAAKREATLVPPRPALPKRPPRTPPAQVEESVPLPIMLGETSASRPVSFMGLDEGFCRWPLDGGLYCGAPTAGIYCAAHDRAAHGQKQGPRTPKYRPSGVGLRCW